MRNAKSRRGLTLIEVAMALAIATLSFLFLARLMADSSSSAQAAADAKKMTMMAKAAQTYLNVEAADLKAFITSPTQVIAIPLARNTQGELPPDGPHATLPSVQKAGLLAAEFIDSNALGQRHVLLVKEPVADKLEGLVVAYGGSAMQDTQLGKLIQSIGMAGGGVFAKDVAPVTATPIANANITGHAGGWTLPVNGWTGASIGATQITVASGRPVVSLSMLGIVSESSIPETPLPEPAPEETDRSTVGELIAAAGYAPPTGVKEWPSAFSCLVGTGSVERFTLAMTGSTLSYGSPNGYGIVFLGDGQFFYARTPQGGSGSTCLGGSPISQICSKTKCEFMPPDEVARNSDRSTVGELIAAAGYAPPTGVKEWPSAFSCLVGTGSVERFTLAMGWSQFSYGSPNGYGIAFLGDGQFFYARTPQGGSGSTCLGGASISQICSKTKCEFMPNSP